MPHKNFWKTLKSQNLNIKETTPLSYYDLLHVLVDSNGNPKSVRTSSEESPSFMAFSEPSKVGNITKKFSVDEFDTSIKTSYDHQEFQSKVFMVGDLIERIANEKIQAIKVNPVLVESNNNEEFFYENLIIAPVKDPLSGFNLICPKEEAIALLAVNRDDFRRLGLEVVVYSITNKDLPETREERESTLKEKIEELSFLIPHTPVAKGSASLITVLLNLENQMEETAFIRNYKTLDKHANVIFVTSDMQIRTGDLENINYNGENLDKILVPLINWQRNL